MTVTAPEAGPVDLEGIDRADAQARALEAAIAAAVTAAIAARVAGIVKDLTDAFGWAVTAPGRWRTARFHLAARLRSVPVRLAETLEPQLRRAAVLGARVTGQPLPGGYDPTAREDIRGMLDGLDTTVRDRLRDAARVVESGRIDTPAQLAQATAKVDAVAKTARSRVEDTVARTVADGAQAATYGTAGPGAEPAEQGEQPGHAGTGGTTGGGQSGAATGLCWWSERRACLSCASLAGSLPGPDGLYRPVLVTASRVSPFIAAGVVPPAHPNCLPGDARVLTRSRITAATSRVFDGEMVTVRTLGQKELTATPNHPVLTDRGWVAIGEVKEGGYLVCDFSPQWVRGVRDDDQDMPPAIKDVVEAFLGSREVLSREVPVSPEDFHGDGAGSEVAVVGTDCGLPAPARREPLCEEIFQSGRVQGGPHFAELGSQLNRLKPILLAAPGSMGIGGVGEALLRGHAGIPGAASLRSSSGSNSCLDELIPDGGSGDGVAVCQSLLADPGHIRLDEVVEVRRNPWVGHVFNLETEDGWYIGNGIVTHNCRCRLVPSTPGLTDVLRREAQREVAYGWSAYDSLRSRLRATDLLLRGGASRLPKTVVRRAEEAVDRGEFTQPPPPR